MLYKWKNVFKIALVVAIDELVHVEMAGIDHIKIHSK